MDYARTAARRLHEQILRELGLCSSLSVPLLLSAVACSSTNPGDDEGGVTTNPSTSNSGTSVSSSSGPDDGPGESESGSDDADDSSDDGVKLDAGVEYDIPPPNQCTNQWHYELESLPVEFAGCSFGPFDDALIVIYQQICVPRPQGGACADICVDSLCEGMDQCLWTEVLESCGWLEVAGDECCTVFATEEPPPVGRPFHVDGQPRLASTRGQDELPALAEHWLELARGEHASIAAFARFVATLLRFGAPARLVADALAAAGDEARHTQLALALASRFAGRPLALRELAITGALTDAGDLAQALRDAVLEGCVGETLAAHEAACLAAHAVDPQVAAALEQIAADEARHAALAWRFVAWALETRPELRGVASRAFTLAGRRATATASLSSTDASAPLGLGCPSASLRASWRAVGLRELVSACAARLPAAPASREHAQV